MTDTLYIRCAVGGEMGDDIDDLLDEVEASFTDRKTSNTLKISYSQTTHSKRSQPKDDELDSMMNEICDIPEPILTQKISASPIPTAAVPGDRKRKCFTVYLAGSGQAEGITTTANQRACDQLRCTDCDFKVSVYKDFAWHSSTDYLFLRNNMPDFSRLEPKLLVKSGNKAYACQCQWRNINRLTEISKHKDLKWVCGKHA